MKRKIVDIWSKGEVVSYLNQLLNKNQIKPCLHLMLEHGHANAFYPHCTKKWASWESASNVQTDTTAYRGPSSYSWPRCPHDCPHFEKIENFTLSVSRDQYHDEQECLEEQNITITEQESKDGNCMSEFELSHEQLQKIKEEVSNWQEFLNITIGTLSFTMGLATISIEQPRFFAWVAIAFLLVLILPNFKKWPPTINGLKKKKDKTEIERIIYQGLMKEYFGLWALFRNFTAYWFGLAFLFLVATGYIEKLLKILAQQ